MSTRISLMRGNFYLDCGAKIRKSVITDSSIDMNGKVITNGGNPIDPSDLATKNYVDIATGNVNAIIPVTLTNTNWSTVLVSTQGTVRMIVKNVILNGPCATFDISKNISNTIADPIRTSSCAGATTQERLQIRWLSGQPLEMRKTGTSYNGVYNVIVSYL